MTQLPVSEFLTARLKEYDPAFELREGTAFEQLFFKPLQFILQPILNDAARLEVSQSFLRILQQDDPDSFDEDAVDALCSNVFVTRSTGSRASGVVRVYYGQAVPREWPTGGAVFTGSSGKTYSNPSPFAITSGEMSAQIEDGNYYYDIPVVATDYGSDSNAEAGGIVSLASDSDVVYVTNKLAIRGGVKRETNTELITRARNSIGVRDLVTNRGLTATLFENFPGSLKEIQAVGHGDPEMMRDIKFNTHLGGKVDVYYKGATIKEGTKNFTALLPDYTRRAKATTVAYLSGTGPHDLPKRGIDRTGGVSPSVEQVKPKTQARILGNRDLYPTVNLSGKPKIRLGVDGDIKDVYVAGATPAATSPLEIVVRINNAFGKPVASVKGAFIELVSPSYGQSSEILLSSPEEGEGYSAVYAIFGLPTSAVHTFKGQGPLLFIEGTDYTVDDEAGTITRLVRQTVVSTQTNGSINSLGQFTSSAAFVGVTEGDIITFGGSDYRIVDVVDASTLVLDTVFDAAADRTVLTAGAAEALVGLRTGEFVRIGGVLNRYTGSGFSPVTVSALSYSVRRGGIKDGEAVYVQYMYNPLSIDIGGSALLEGGARGVRPGREDQTITETAFLRVKEILLIDPLTEEPTGDVLKTGGGFGAGPFGAGGFGVGQAYDYRLVVLTPNERFSVFEEGYIELDQSLMGLSFQVVYEYAEDTADLHNFCRSENQRVLDGDILVKHFLPAYVSGTIRYSVNASDASVPSNEVLTGVVKDFITAQKAGSELKFSDIYQVLARATDPFDRYGTFIRPITLAAVVHNLDGSLTTVRGTDSLKVPTSVASDTKRPLTPRITHWIADDIVLERI